MADAPAWVLDSNVLVSGLLSPLGLPGRLVDVLLNRRLRLAFDDRMEFEYREVLARPRLGIEHDRRQAFLTSLSPSTMPFVMFCASADPNVFSAHSSAGLDPSRLPSVSFTCAVVRASNVGSTAW